MLSFKDTMQKEYEVENPTLTDNFSVIKNAETNSNALSSRCYLYKNANNHWMCNRIRSELSFQLRNT